MSFFTDLFEGNFGNLGTDLSHTFSSLASHPDQLAETLGVGGLALGGIGALGGFADLGIAGIDAGTLGAADAASGAVDAGIGGITGDTVEAIGPDLAGSSSLSLLDSGAGLPLSDATSFDISSFIGSGDVGQIGTSTAGADTGVADAGLQEAQHITDQTLSSSVGGAATPTPSPTDGGLTSHVADLTGPTGTIGTGTATSTGGITSGLSSALSSPWTKLAIGAAPLALALARGEPSLGSAGQQAQQDANALAAYGQQQLALGTSGQLTPAQSAVIAKMQQDLTNQWRQVLFNQGVQDPTKDGRWPEILATIDTQVTAATQQMIQQTIQNGLTALGQGGQQLATISAQQLQADTNFTNTLVNATKALGTTVAGGSTVKLVTG